jgi:hypothetical protein
MCSIELPNIFALRLVDRRWWITAPSSDPIERAPFTLGLTVASPLPRDKSACVRESVGNLCLVSPLRYKKEGVGIWS